MRRSEGVRALALIGAATLAACSGPTPYQPARSASSTSGGYSSQQIEANRYRVTFAGNNYTARETVENYLLYRAAELTLEKGYDGFTVVRRATDKDVNTRVEPYGPSRSGYWSPYWRYWGPRFGWRTWDPYFGDPFWANSVDVDTVERYEASAEIVMFKGEKPGDNPAAFDAREVVENLEPTIQRPS
jgi:hypothetical protein